MIAPIETEKVHAFVNNLLTDKEALKYVTDRGVSMSSILEYGIGYAPRNRFDTYCHRITFPVCDIQGKVVAFQRRAIEEGDTPKYWHNSYEKSKVLFGLNIAYDLVLKRGFCVVVEGPFDVIALRQSGIPAVCTMGTAMSEDHALQLAMLTDTVVMSFDNDKAGGHASKNAYKLLSSYDIDVCVTQLSGTKDFNEVYMSEGKDAVRYYVYKALVKDYDTN